MLSTIIGLDDESFSFALCIDAKEESVLHTISATFTNMSKLVQSRDSLPVYLRQGSNTQRELRPATPLAAEQAFDVVSGFFLGRWTRRHLPKIF